VNLPRIKCKSETKISNIKTGKIYKDEAEVQIEILKQNVMEKDIRRDTKVIVPEGLDLFGEKPLK
jgi:hypothetical protein